MSIRLLGKLCLVLAVVIAGAGLVQGAYLRNVPVHVQQPDGTTLSCLASGDEFYSWLHDKDGYTIIRNSETGYLVYADKVDGKLVPTQLIAGRADALLLERAGIPKNLLDDLKPRQKILAVPLEEPILNAPKTGTLNNLVVYIRFADQEEYAGSFIDNTAGFFNSTEPSVNSMRNYYAEATYNQLAISTTFYPGSSPGVYSYQDSYPCAYYIPYDAATNPTGYNGDTERRTREHTLLQNAVNAIAAEVPGGLNIDADGDNYVDNVCFVVKGEPTAWNSLLWPHMWSLYTYNVYINAKRVYTYNFQMETSLDVGVLCHEMFHSLGAPDLYHYSQDGLHPVWAWDLMEYNLDPPEHMTAYMKWKYGTWISSIPEITTSGTYTLNPLKSTTNNCYKIVSPFSSTEYFVVEYRKMTGGGTFEGNLYNEGLLVYRINSTVTTGNRLGPPDEVYIYRPNGTTTTDGEPWIAPFSANQTRTQINDATNPSSFLTDGSPGGLSISNVGYYGDTISFDVSFNTITVTSPNGGGSWPALGNATVTWMSTGSIGTVDILLSTDGGTNWTTLADNTPNDGSETVAVPLIASTACFIQVREGVAGAPNDYSDASFSIAVPVSQIAVAAPNGGEQWAAGSSHNVTWTQTGLTGSVIIDLYKNWVFQKTLGTADVAARTYIWAISAEEMAGSDYRIRITRGEAWDISDANFAIIVTKAIPFNEDFSTTASGWLQQNIGEGMDPLWSFSATNHSGGVANEVQCRWWDIDPGTTRLITPALDTAGLASLRLKFKHYLDAYGTGCTLKIQTSPDKTTWTDEAWTISSTSSDIGPATVETVLTHNLGITTTYVAFVITGNLYQYDFWYIDDVEISANEKLRWFVKDVAGHYLWMNTMLTDESFEGWQPLQGGTSTAAAVASFNDRLHLIVRDAVGDTLWYQNMDSEGTWSGWVPLGGSSPSTPSMAVFNNKLYVAIQEVDNRILCRSQDMAGTWSGWTEFPGATSTMPVLASFNGKLHLVVKDLAYNFMWWNSMDTTETWSGWQQLTGESPSPVAMAEYNDKLYMFVRGNTDDLYFRSMDTTGAWGTWTMMVGATSIRPTIAAFNGRLYLVVKDANGYYIWMRSMDETEAFGGWTKLPGGTSVPIALVSF